MKKILFLLLCLFWAMLPNGIAQNLYDNDRLSADFHAQRRKALREKMPEKSVAVIFANPVRQRNNDVDFQYTQNSNLYYLTGYLEPNAVLVITKDKIAAMGEKSNEFFFVQDRDKQAEVWTGRRLGKEGVEQELKIQGVSIGAEWENFDFNSLKNANQLLLNQPTGIADKADEEADLYDLVRIFEEKTEGKEKSNSGLDKLLAELRQIKTPEELALMQKAIDMTCDGHIAVMQQLRPDMYEYQAQAIMEYKFKDKGSEYCGYPSICGGAENACVLHYITNRRKLQDGDMFLFDCGAEYHGYTADITRTVPVNGKFTAEQKTIYDLVLAAQEAGFKQCKAGNSFWSTSSATSEVIAEGLFKLGIIQKKGDAQRYFMHGTSHYLGLDVHDAGDYGVFKSDEVITVEPGIYIPIGSPCDKKWWNIGIRIEDDVLITQDGYKILSLAAPRSTEEIEKMMAKNK